MEKNDIQTTRASALFGKALAREVLENLLAEEETSNLEESLAANCTAECRTDCRRGCTKNVQLLARRTDVGRTTGRTVAEGKGEVLSARRLRRERDAVRCKDGAPVQSLTPCTLKPSREQDAEDRAPVKRR